jgi:hypothetical protein
MKPKGTGTKKKRRLWTRITAHVPKGTTRSEFWGTIRKSIREGDYALPDDWDVRIHWKNKADAEYKSDDYTTAMIESAESSRGWDRAIARYVEKQIDKLSEPRKVPARVGALTKRIKHAKRSAAAREGWRRRKATFRRRSAAARKGWRTRRARSRKGGRR